MSDTYEKPALGWTCFHCGETFTTVGGAQDHFGADPSKEPGCMLKVSLGAERGLLMKLRALEDELTTFYQRRAAEDTDLHREIHALQSRHADALQTAEELGFERGLRAGRPALVQRKDLLAAALYIASNNDEAATLTSEAAERIVGTLHDVGQLDELIATKGAANA